MADLLRTTRRRLLVSTGSLTALGLAGCVSEAQRTFQPESGAAGAATHAESEEATESHHDESEGETLAAREVTAEAHHDDPQAHEDEGHGQAGPSERATVEMITNESGHHFHPHVAWIEVGGTVTFRNVSGVHSATAYHPNNGKPLRMPEGNASFDSGLLSEEGATFENVFETEGVYDVYCTPHEAMGMIGSVIVGEPDPHNQPGLAEPQRGMAESAATKIESLNHTVNTALGHTHDDDDSTESEDHDEPEDGHHDEPEDGHHDETEDGHHDETEDGHSH